MNNFKDQIEKAADEVDVVAWAVYNARHYNQSAIWCDGLTKEAFILRRNEYMKVARKFKESSK